MAQSKADEEQFVKRVPKNGGKSEEKRLVTICNFDIKYIGQDRTSFVTALFNGKYLNWHLTFWR